MSVHIGSEGVMSHKHALPGFCCDIPSSPVNLEMGLLFVDVTASMMGPGPYPPINPPTGFVNIL